MGVSGKGSAEALKPADGLVQVDPSLLPPVLRELVSLIGMSETCRLAEARGGVRTFVPYRAHPGCKLAKYISMSAVNALVQEYPGEYLEVPKADSILRQLRNLAIRQARGNKSKSQLALEFHLSARQVQNIWHSDEDNPTGDLFE